jgi:hypothetical protein
MLLEALRSYGNTIFQARLPLFSLLNGSQVGAGITLSPSADRAPHLLIFLSIRSMHRCVLYVCVYLGRGMYGAEECVCMHRIWKVPTREGDLESEIA